jgi:tungstate transport system ATP-binding protein
VSILPLTLSAAIVRKHGKRIVGPVDLTISGSGATVLLGPNGAGKTTLLRMMHGLDRVSAGRAQWAVGRDEADLRQAYVFQTPILLRRTVLDNAAYPLQIRGQSRKDARRTAAEKVAEVGLADALQRPAHVLSGGEKQKLALARALVTQPEVLFLDEPTASLDGRSTREIETILAAAQTAGTKIIMATHDLGQARRIASDILFLLNGSIHESGAAKAFFAGPVTPEAGAFLKGDIVE